MTLNALASFALGLIIGSGAVGIVSKMYADNLRHTACKMYNAVEDPYRFNYVNKQFRCTTGRDK
jgi:hypothetical protein